eukprot:sb/3475957/
MIEDVRIITNYFVVVTQQVLLGGDVHPKSHGRTKALLELCDEVNAWTFLNPDYVDEHLIHLKSRKKKKTSRAMASNIVVVKPWESLSDEQKEELTPTTKKVKIHTHNISVWPRHTPFDSYT